MKYTILIITSFLLLGGAKCNNTFNKEYLFQKWVHNQAEDKNNVQAFRPEGYPLPPARGRTGIEFKKDGSFINYEIAPTDGSLLVNGNWEQKNKNSREINVSVKAGKVMKKGIIKVVFLSKDKLECIINWK